MGKKKPSKTRYPKAGKGLQWTIKELQALTPNDVGYTLNDGGSLSGTVHLMKNGEISIRWRFAYKWNEKVRRFSCGTYPAKSMAEIRKARDKARALVQEGLDPREAIEAKKIQKQTAIKETIALAEQQKIETLTFYDLFEEWVANGVARQDGNVELRRAFEKDIFPTLKNIQINKLTEADLLKAYRRIKKRSPSSDPQRGLNRTLERLHADVSQMLSWADKRQPWRQLLAHGNPAELVDISILISDHYQEYRDRVLSPDEIQELAQIFLRVSEEYDLVPPGQKYSVKRPFPIPFQCAIWICLSTLCRIGELLKAKWEDIDLVDGTWFIPAENTKGKKGKRKSLTISLSDFALAQFQLLHSETGHTDFCFPSRNDPSKAVDEKSISRIVGNCQLRFKSSPKKLSKRRNDDSLVLSDGKNGKWTPHDLRRTGATIMQQLGVPLEIIDRCQNHVLSGARVRRHYLHYDYADEMAAAWQQLGNYLDQVLANKVCS